MLLGWFAVVAARRRVLSARVVATGRGIAPSFREERIHVCALLGLGSGARQQKEAADHVNPSRPKKLVP